MYEGTVHIATELDSSVIILILLRQSFIDFFSHNFKIFLIFIYLPFYMVLSLKVRLNLPSEVNVTGNI